MRGLRNTARLAHPGGSLAQASSSACAISMVCTSKKRSSESCAPEERTAVWHQRRARESRCFEKVRRKQQQLTARDVEQ